ncbi:SusC/RagA family TonB-linked outer membrane protein [Bacteroides cutis]|jgi:TonB-linked SusC/RagA family outer membrane protein|uniref:SusC/RagA family TonB-linked outer membrane protein n=1 Tax=Bacteroides cutis TaxID=2024197 RepID=UPI0023A8CB89|nr:TonB-dependent receptor [Bacteroides cutis]
MRERTQRKRIWVTGIYILLFLSTPLSAQMASPLQGNVETTIESAATIDTGGELTPDGKKIVKGFVSDEHGESIIGATVVVKGHPETGTVTDVDGKFTLEVEPRSILVISYIGYNPQETRVSRKTPFYNIILKEDNQLLEEVVVVGYGTVKKSDLTGSVSTVGTRSFESQPVTNVSQILQGRTSGVEVTSTSGMPGSGAKVRIRGTTSINKSSDPLYVIDGIISSSGLDGLNPQDIQSMEILKDASSTAIYGSRGANGVILVTTRSGEEGRARVTFNAKIGLSSVRKDYDLLNAYEYAQALNDIRGSQTISPEDMEAYHNGTKGINWLDLMTRTALSQDYNVGISGGTEKVKYLLSGNVLDQQAVTINSKYKRYGFRANINADIRPWLSLSARLNTAIIHQENGAPSWFHVLNFSPTMELRDPETGIYNNDPYNIGTGNNPYGVAMENYSDSYSYNVNANLNLLFKIAKGLTFNIQGGYDYDHSPSYSFSSKLIAPGAINSMSNSSSLHRYWQNTNNLTYQGQWGDHSLTATGVWEISRTIDTGLSASGSNLNNESVGYWNISNAAVRSESNSYTEASLASGIIRASYDYKKRYFLTAALRADGSSKFQKDHRWGWFPSAAVAWDVAKEKFMANQKILKQLKLRASYGVTGNEAISAYSTLGMLSGTSYGWGTTTGYTGYWGNQFATPELTWEKTYQYDIGLDVSLLGIDITVDWFKKRTVDLLFQKQVPRYNGGGSYWVNQGKLNNTGVEFSFSTFPVKSTLVWETSFNASYIKNEVIDLAGNDFVLSANYSDLGGAMQIMKPGYPLGSFYVYQWKGFDENGANLYQKADGSLTTTPTSADLVIKGQSSPKWTLGWNNTLSWKNWTLNIFFNAATGYNRLNISRFTTASMSGVSRFISLRDAYFRGWDYVDNKAEALYPSISNTDNKSYANSDFWLEDASFVKLKNISLSYNIPRRATKIAGIQLTVSAQDVFTLTKYKGMDPEVYTGYDGLDYGAYPVPRTFTFAVKLRF